MGAASADDDDASDDTSNGDGEASGLPNDAQATASAAAVAAFSVLKQEFVADESPVKEEFDGDGDASAEAAGAGAGSSRQPRSYPIQKKTFPSAAATAATALAVVEAGGSSLGGGMDGGGAATPLVVDGEPDVKRVVPGALLAAHNAAASAKAAAEERRGFLGDAQKRDRFNEFVTGFLSMSMFHAADVWLPLASGTGSGNGGGSAGGSGSKKVSRLFLYSSNVQDPALAKWSTLSRNVVLAAGVGLPGIVFQERRPQWAVRELTVPFGVMMPMG